MLVDTPTSSTVLVSEEQMEKTESFLSKLRNLAASHLGGNVRLGIDFQSEHLYNLSPQVLEAYMSLLNGIIQRKRISASELDSVLVATNCLTLKQSPVIIGVASALGLPTFSTEVLRSDHRRPEIPRVYSTGGSHILPQLSSGQTIYPSGMNVPRNALGVGLVALMKAKMGNKWKKALWKHIIRFVDSSLSMLKSYVRLLVLQISCGRCSSYTATWKLDTRRSNGSCPEGLCN
jgi:hypothetical protein